MPSVAFAPLPSGVPPHRPRMGRLVRRHRHAPRTRQRLLFCLCGAALPATAGLCRPCYRRRQLSRERFGGNRDEVLARDAHQCQGCGAREQVVVHHRHPGAHEAALLVTLCAACHARLHRLRAVRRWIPPRLLPLWEEQHPGVAMQLQLDLFGAAG